MKLYQLTYLITPELNEEQIKGLQEKINSLIQKEGGILSEAKKEVKKRLFSSIKKNNQAFLATLNFQLKPEKIEILEKEIKQNPKILRYLILSQNLPKKVIQPIKSKGAKPKQKKKVELKDIEKKLEEILQET